MKTRLIWAAAIIVTLLAGVFMPVMAGEPAPPTADSLVQVTLTPSTEELSVGDPVQLALQVSAPAGYQVIVPKLEQHWGPFEVRDQSAAVVETMDDGTQSTQQIIEVTVYDLGSFETPALQLTIRDAAGRIFQETGPSVTLNVIPSLPEDDSDLRDIKPQASLRVPPIWPWLAGGVVAVLLLGLLCWWAYRRRHGKPFGLGRGVDSRPPWQVAYDELERIESLGLIEQRSFKRHYTLVTDCLRAYMESLLDTQVFDRTTYELGLILKRYDLVPLHTRQILDLVMESDLVKFAKLTPDPDVARQLVDRVRVLVDETRPAPEPQEAEAGGPPPQAPATASQFGYSPGQ